MYTDEREAIKQAVRAQQLERLIAQVSALIRQHESIGDVGIDFRERIAACMDMYEKTALCKAWIAFYAQAESEDAA